MSSYWFDYQLENFDPSPDEELICSICRCVFFDPVECPCRHVFCRKCISQWLASHKSCPACRKRTSRSSLQEVVPIIKNMIMKLTLVCRNSDKGCEHKCTVELYESHLKSCGYETVGCPNEGCRAEMFRMEMEHHEYFECPYRAVTCETCRQEIQLSARMSHDCIRELLRVIAEKDARLAELQRETDALRLEIEQRRQDQERFKESVPSSSDSSDFGSMSSISVSGASSNNEDSFLGNYSLRIFSVLRPGESLSASVSATNEVQNEMLNAQEPNTDGDFTPMEFTFDSTDYPKPPSPDLDSHTYSTRVSTSGVAESAEEPSSSTGMGAEGFSQSLRRPLKRRMRESTETPVSLNLTSRSSPTTSPFYEDFQSVVNSSRMAYSDTERPRTSSSFASTPDSSTFQNRNREDVHVVDETIEILDSSDNGSNSGTSSESTNTQSVTSPGSDIYTPHVGTLTPRANSNYFLPRNRSRLLKRCGFKGRYARATYTGADKHSASSAPCSRVPLPVSVPGSNSTPVLPDFQRASYHPVGLNSTSESLGETDIFSSTPPACAVLKKTLSLLAKCDRESDPDWEPARESESDLDSISSSSSESCSENDVDQSLSHARQENENCDSSSDSESWCTENSDTDSSYEVVVPPTTLDLIKRYCNDDSDDSDWRPHSTSRS